jgi:hypothetical protein
MQSVEVQAGAWWRLRGYSKPPTEGQKMPEAEQLGGNGMQRRS